jgi:hypothetical protein
VGGHVEKEKIALFGPKDAFINEAFGKAFPNLFELKADFHHIPCFPLESISLV